MFIGLLFLTLLRGSANAPSIIGIQRCSALDWLIQLAFIVICCLLTRFSIKKVKQEQEFKKIAGMGLVESDIDFSYKNLVKLVGFAFLGGWVSGALGLGGGAIFNPLLLSMGVHPSVSSSTGMYMIMFSTAASSTVYILFGMLHLSYALWLGAWCALGSVLGLYLLDMVTEKYNRQSPIVMVLTFILGISALLVPIFGAINLVGQAKAGADITKFSSIC